MLGLIGGIGSLLGSGLGAYANYKAGNAMDDVVKKQLEQQRAYQDKGNAIYQGSLAQSTPSAAQGQIGAAQARGLYDRLQSVPLNTNTSQAVSDPAQSNARASAYGQLLGVPNAELQGITNYNLQQWIKDLQANTALGVNNFQAGNSASAYPYKVQDAAHSQDTLSGIGSLLSTFGGLAGQYGAGQQGFQNGLAQSSNPAGLTPAQIQLGRQSPWS